MRERTKNRAEVDSLFASFFAISSMDASHAAVTREVANMTGAVSREHGCDIESLILRALVKKLVARGVLSPEDVRALLYDAVKGMDIVIQANMARTYQNQEAANEIVVERD
jgi:phage tail tape-measure protein